MTLSAQVDFQKEEYGPPVKKKDTQDTLIERLDSLSHAWPELSEIAEAVATALADRDAELAKAQSKIAERTKERDLARAEKDFWRTADANSVARAKDLEAQVAELLRERRELTQKLGRAEAALYDEMRSVAIVQGNFKEGDRVEVRTRQRHGYEWEPGTVQANGFVLLDRGRFFGHPSPNNIRALNSNSP